MPQFMSNVDHPKPLCFVVGNPFCTLHTTSGRWVPVGDECLLCLSRMRTVPAQLFKVRKALFLTERTDSETIQTLAPICSEWGWLIFSPFVCVNPFYNQSRREEGDRPKHSPWPVRATSQTLSDRGSDDPTQKQWLAGTGSKRVASVFSSKS